MYFMLDNYDSFVYNLSAYVKELGREILVKRADQITVAEVEAMNPEGIIISPGPGKPSEAHLSHALLDRFAGEIPIFRCLPGPSGYCGEIRRPGEKRSPPHARKSDTDHQYGRGNLSGTAGEILCDQVSFPGGEGRTSFLPQSDGPLGGRGRYGGGAYGLSCIRCTIPSGGGTQRVWTRTSGKFCEDCRGMEGRACSY